MIRPADNVFEPDEALYRRLTVNDVQGSRVLPNAIDLRGTSVDREKYSTIEDSWARCTADEVLLGRIVCQDLPKEVAIGDGSSANASVYEFFAEDLPLETNVAHAEVRHRQKGADSREAAKKPKSPTSREKLKRALAAQITLLPRGQQNEPG